jgi:hypothetical protein
MIRVPEVNGRIKQQFALEADRLFQKSSQGSLYLVL